MGKIIYLRKAFVLRDGTTASKIGHERLDPHRHLLVSKQERFKEMLRRRALVVHAGLCSSARDNKMNVQDRDERCQVNRRLGVK